MRFSVEQMRDGTALKRVDLSAASDVEAAKAWGPVIVPQGREPTSGEWIRVTQYESGRTSWFRVGE
ncbi:hypothetical protein FJ973_29585 [Mesorhizobium sp. B2-1-3]|nr:hypothetical protein FJ973_29585 [Mesorhizobium sp. B2-1-3]